jgi:hypothetical protein
MADLSAGVAAVTTASRRRPSGSSDTGHRQPAMASASATGKIRWFDHLDAAARSAAHPRHDRARRRRGCGDDVKPASPVRCRGLGRRFLHAVSPWRLLVRLRDAYMNAMLRLESLRHRRLRFCPAPRRALRASAAAQGVRPQGAHRHLTGHRCRTSAGGSGGLTAD